MTILEALALLSLLVTALVFVFVDICKQAELHSEDDDAAEEPA